MPLIRRMRVFMTEIYAAGEQPIPGVSGEKLAEAVRAAGHPSVTFVGRKEIVAGSGVADAEVG